MINALLRYSMALLVFTFPAFANNELPLREGHYLPEGIICGEGDNSDGALLRNQRVTIAADRCDFSEPKLVGDGEYSLQANCDQAQLRAEYLNEVQLKIIAPDSFLFDDGLQLRKFEFCSVE